MRGLTRITLLLLLSGGLWSAGAEDKGAPWASSGSTPGEWLRPGYFYISSISVGLAPNEALCTLALVGHRKVGGPTPIAGLVIWRGVGEQAYRVASVTWPDRENWDYAIHRDDLIDLDGDGYLEIGVREAIGTEGEWIRSTTWYRIAGLDLVPVYHLTRHARMFDREERRDMVVEAPGRVRERISIEEKTAGLDGEMVHREYDVQYQYSPALGRFAPVSTRVLR